MTESILKVQHRTPGTRNKILLIACGSPEMRKIVSCLGPKGIGEPEFVIRKDLGPLCAETFGKDGALLGAIWVCEHGKLHCKSFSILTWRHDG